MCGVVGIWSRETRGLARVTRLMADRLAHRGPDASGVWVDEGAGIALGHRRLAIVDLSESGAQPMHSECGRYVISFNGEIYNHADLRRELEMSGHAPTWRGSSDTEMLLAGFVAWGIEETLRRSVGMFAIALWDREERSLTLMRDRYGEKPLYFGTVGEGASSSFAFASELKALRALPNFTNEIDRKSVAEMLQISVVAAPRTIYRDIHQLKPGHFVTMSFEDASRRSFPQRPYWRIEDVAQAGLSDPYATEDEALKAVHAALRQSIKGQMVADVPVGAFLSGGTDSSLIVALMQEQSSRPVKTFTISFGKKDLDEAPYAEAIARHLGTDHTTIPVTDQDAINVVPSLTEMYDEPFADSSQIPVHLLCKGARRDVTVALSGDGGDEVFGGYNRYVTGPALVAKLNRLPSVLRSVAGHALRVMPPSFWDVAYNLLPGAKRYPLLDEKVEKVANALLHVRSVRDLYDSLINKFPKGIPPVLGLGGDHIKASAHPVLNGADDVDSMMLWDASGYLPNDLLTKIDRAAMAVSLETRTPYLDHRVAEVAWRLPRSLKISDGTGKQAPRKLLSKYIPNSSFARPKAGFAVPLTAWLRGPLKEWGQALLDERRLMSEGFVDAVAVRRLWSEHQSGRRNRSAALWNILMFQSWLQLQKDAHAANSNVPPLLKASA